MKYFRNMYMNFQGKNIENAAEIVNTASTAHAGTKEGAVT